MLCPVRCRQTDRQRSYKNEAGSLPARAFSSSAARRKISAEASVVVWIGPNGKLERYYVLNMNNKRLMNCHTWIKSKKLVSPKREQLKSFKGVQKTCCNFVISIWLKCYIGKIHTCRGLPISWSDEPWRHADARQGSRSNWFLLNI